MGNLVIENETILKIFTYFSHVLWAIVILLPMTRFGKTVGMHLTEIKVYDIGAGEATAWQRFLRESIFILPMTIISIFPELMAYSWAIGLIFLQATAISIANPIFVYIDPKHRGLNDLVAKTIILRIKNGV